ncbi:Rho GTPase-activating protein 24 [Hordeum vulgare]|nr:Rho GTPase-activating protein 24 [Hordeum vulgare]
MKDVECDDAEEEEVEEEQPAVVEPPAKGRKKKNWPTNTRSSEPPMRWMPKEDECLAEAWKTVSLDPITDANQNSNTY